MIGAHYIHVRRGRRMFKMFSETHSQMHTCSRDIQYQGRVDMDECINEGGSVCP